MRMPRRQATTAVEKRGGMVTNHVNKSTDILVIATVDRRTDKIEHAMEIVENGGKIAIMTEQEFYKALRKRR